MASSRENGDGPGSPSGVDESLIDEMLALSPDERLRQNDRMLRAVELLRQRLAESTGDDGR